jgi:hypothetical protein
MTNFLRFTTTDDRIIYIDTDNIVMISEHRYRLNDIGYVGSTISFHVGTAASSINVKDDPEAVHHYMRNAELVHDQEMYLPKIQGKTIRCTDPANFEELRKSFDMHKFVGELAKEQESRPELKTLDHVIYEVNGQVYQILAVLRDNCYRIQGQNHSMSYPDEHVVHASKLTKCQPYRVRPEPTTYRTPPQETPPCNGNGEAQSTEE